MQHNKITGADVHVLHAFTYADVTARTGATGFTAEDVGKAALQQSDTTLWGLTNHSPITWVQIGTGAPPGPHTHAEADVTGLVADLANKADVGHTHPESDVTGLVADLASKADVGHVHDDRYYTETETDTLLSNKAPLVSPALTGTPTAPTAAAGTDTTQIATTAFVAAAVAAGGGGSGGGSTTPTAAVRQTVLSGRVDSNGFANFIEAGSGLAAVVKGASVPVLVAFANGFDTTGASVDYFGRITTDSTINGLTASATNYLYATYAAGTVSVVASTAQPLYGVTASTPAGTTKFTPNMTAANAPSPYVASASNEYGTDAAYKAFDGTGSVSGTSWYTTNNSAWIKIDLGSPVAVLQYALTPLVSDHNYGPSSWTFEGSNDNTNWTVLDTRSGQPSARTPYSLSNTTAYRYYRVNISAGGGTWGISLTEIELFKAATSSDNVRWFDLSTMIPKKWDGSAWTTENWCALGEAVTNGSGVTSAVAYALHGQYLPDTYSVAANTNITKNHNIGTDKILVQALVATSSGGAQAVVLPSSVSRNSVIYNSGAGAVESRVVARRAF